MAFRGLSSFCGGPGRTLASSLGRRDAANTIDTVPEVSFLAEATSAVSAREQQAASALGKSRTGVPAWQPPGFGSSTRQLEPGWFDPLPRWPPRGKPTRPHPHLEALMRIPASAAGSG